MFWYSWLFLALFVICCVFLIGSVLLQSGKGDLASALGGGGAQNAFGPRGAASTLARVTLIAASGFMILAFTFSLPNILGSGSVATDLDKDPLAPKASPTPLASPATSPAPVATGETAPAPATTLPPAPNAEDKGKAGEAKTDDKAKTDAATDKKDNKDSKDSKDAKPASK
ncbi:MAG: preprotein translocase subunit SecG [Acidobacteria bacterium]|nr:preprotein translocase subunit SecG [Acidobacteriota bacterium]